MLFKYKRNFIRNIICGNENGKPYEGYVKDGKLVGVKAHVRLNGGAYKGCSGVVLSRALIAVIDCYNVPNLDITGDVYITNTMPTAAFRGFGSPQTIFAFEMFINHPCDRFICVPSFYLSHPKFIDIVVHFAK